MDNSLLAVRDINHKNIVVERGFLHMYTGNYECLELFVKPEAGKKGSVSLKKVKENKTEIKELQHIYGN